MTLSPRLSDGHSEPSFSSNVDCVLQNVPAHNNTIVQMNGSRYYTVSVHCKNITALGKGEGKLGLTNTKQPFLYAWGPTDNSISSASKSASIKRHVAYGNFWMDMTAATSSDTGEVALPTSAALLSTQNAGADGQAESDGDKVGPAHAAIMLAAYVIIFPLGAILLRFLESVKAHYIVQTLGLLATIIGAGVGIYLSTMYNHVSIWLVDSVLADTNSHSQKIFPPVIKFLGLSSRFSCLRNGPPVSTITCASESTDNRQSLERYIYTLVQPLCWEASSMASLDSTSVANPTITSTMG